MSGAGSLVRNPSTLAGPSPPKTFSPGGDQEWWVEPVKWLALAVWLAIPIFTYLDVYSPWPAHIVWSAVVASLPLFIVLGGYHRWRRICPLAFFSQIPVLVRRPGIRFIVLAGEAIALHRAGTGDEVVIDRHPAGSVIGEIAVLDQAPRPATLRADAGGVRVMRLDGRAFREALHADPAVAHEVIVTRARRVRGLIQRAGV